MRAVRRARHLTMRQLAQAAGCSDSMIAALENDQRNPRMDMALRLARALDTTTGQLWQLVPVAAYPIMQEQRDGIPNNTTNTKNGIDI